MNELKPCKDCGTMISSNAQACPQCGRKLREGPGAIAAIVVAIIVVYVLMSIAVA